MKKIILVGLLFCTWANAEDTDRLSILSKTLAEGSYTLAHDVELPREEKKQNKKVEYKDVSREELTKLGFKPSYADSIIKKDTDGDYYEVKRFPDGNYMYRILNTTNGSVIAAFPIEDEDNPLNEGWKVVCQVDMVTNQKNCSVNKYEVMVLKSSKYGLAFSVSKEANKLNPLSDHYVRIDKNTPMKSRSVFTGQQAVKIIDQMKSGEIMRTRFHEYGDTYEEVIYLNGFTNAYNFMNMVYPQVK